MKTGLSKREKFLVFTAVLVVLLFVSTKYIIMPLYNFYNTMSEQYDSMYSEKALLEIKLQNEAATRLNRDNAQAVFEKVEERYPAFMPNEEIDRILTGMCKNNGLNSVTLGILDAVSFNLPEQAREQNESDTGAAASQATPAFVTVTANMLLTGSYSSLKSLISDVEKIDYIRIIRVSFSDALSNSDENKIAAPNISVFFEITMLRDTE